MDFQIGSTNTPLRVAIIGSGPAGFYAAEHLQKQEEQGVSVEVDMFDRLPTPFGLVRGGVAPDHPKIKAVTKVYERIAAKPNFRFYGNVTFGRDICLADLQANYHAIIYAVGAQSDRPLGIPGENLSGSHAATEFVAWYNAHPDYRHFEFDLSQEKVAVIGLGNVAMDVIRILAQDTSRLAETDIADYALEALSQSKVKEIYVLGRRGPAQAAFTNPEIKELGELENAEVIIAPTELELDPYSAAFIESKEDRGATRNVDILRRYAEEGDLGKQRKIIMRFLTSPVELIGTDHVEAIKIVKNELYLDDNGNLRPRATDQYETIPVGLVFRSVGYRGVPLPDTPFDEKRGVIPNVKGRVLTAPDSDTPLTGCYVSGWIKRGPSGVIGTNRPDSVETVDTLLEDFASGKLLNPANPSRNAVESLLKERGVKAVSFDDWLRLDTLEQARGQASQRPRVKFSQIDEMLQALNEAPSPAID